MPWTASVEGTLPSLKNKSKEAREIFARVANAALAKGQTEEEAIYAGLAVVAAHERKKEREVKKEFKPIAKAEVVAPITPTNTRNVISQAFLPKNAITPDPDRSLVASSWDNNGRLILQFDDGKKIITDPVPVSENIEQFISVSTDPFFDFIKFETEANVDLIPGMLAWNKAEDCLDIQHEDGSTLQVGLEQHMQVMNDTGETLPNGSLVQFSGVSLEENPEVSLLTASPGFTPLYTVGILTNSIEDGGLGRATVFGKVRQLNTTGSSVGETWLQGDLLWAHPTVAGGLTNVKPAAPYPAISIAAVLKVHATEGVILVRPTIFPRMYYANYKSLVAQTAVAPNTPYAVKFETTDIQSGVSILDQTKIKPAQSGLYSFDFRLQLTSGNSSAKNIYIWASKNGTAIPNSTTKVSISGSSTELVASWNFVYTMQNSDYFELMYAVDDTALVINSPVTPAFCPTIPSAIIKVNQVDL